LRNLFPYGLDFRVAYTRAAPTAGNAAQQQQPKPTAAAVVAKSKGSSSSSGPSRLDSSHPHTGGSGKFEFWGHLAPGQHVCLHRLQMARDPYLAFRLDGFAWSERVPLGHLNPDTTPFARGMAGAGGGIDAAAAGVAEMVGEMFGLGGSDEDTGSSSGLAGSSSFGPRGGLGAGADFLASSGAATTLLQHVARHHVSLEDSNGNPLVAQLESRRCGPLGGGIELDLFAQYWLVNRTGLDLMYGARIHDEDDEDDLGASASAGDDEGSNGRGGQGGGRSSSRSSMSHHRGRASSTDEREAALRLERSVRTLPGHGRRVQVCCHENQRYSVLDGWVSPFLPTDRAPYTDPSGHGRTKDQFKLPSEDGSWAWEGEWEIDFGHGRTGALGDGKTSGGDEDLFLADSKGGAPLSLTDGNGWEYALDFVWPFHPANSMMDAVRRRRWVRSYVSTRSLRPLCLHSTNLRGAREELCVRVAPLPRGEASFKKVMHTKSGRFPPLLRVRQSTSSWSTPFAASASSDGLLWLGEKQLVDVATEEALEEAKWKRAAARVMAQADAGANRAAFNIGLPQLQQGGGAANDAEEEKKLGPLSAHVAPRARYRRSNRYDIGVTFHSCPGLFWRSSLIAFTPRFLLVNELSYALYFRQAGAHHRGRVLVQSIEPGRFQPFWWTDIDRQRLGSEEDILGSPPLPQGQSGARPAGMRPPQQSPSKPKQVSPAEYAAQQGHLRGQNVDFDALASIAFESSATERWRWTGAFRIDELGELSLAVRSSAMTSRFLRVTIATAGGGGGGAPGGGSGSGVAGGGSASIIVRFREEDLRCPRYRLENTTSCPMWYRQKLDYVEQPRPRPQGQGQGQGQGYHQDDKAEAAAAARIELLDSLSRPTWSDAPVSGGASSQGPAGSPAQAAAQSASQSQGRPLIPPSSLSPWLYLGPGESTPFAWQELLAPKPFKLEIVTASPHNANVANRGAGAGEADTLARAAARARGVLRVSAPPESSPPAPSAAATPSKTNALTSFFTRATTSSLSPAQVQANRRAAALAAVADAEARARARLGQFDFFLCDSVQLDEIGYSLVEMQSQTFVDVFVSDQSSSGGSERQKKHANAAAGGTSSAPGGSRPRGNSTGSSSHSSASHTTTKIMKLVRKSTLRDLGVAEAAALLSMEEKAERSAAAAALVQEGAGAAPGASKPKSTTSAAAAAAAAAAASAIEDDYIPVHKRELRVELPTLFVEFSLAKFSLSLIDALPRELCLLSLRGLALTYSASNIYRKLEVQLADAQLDNQMVDAVFPVALHQRREGSRAFGTSAQESQDQMDQDMLQGSAAAATAKAKTKHSGGTAGSSTALTRASAAPRRPFLHLSVVKLTRYSSSLEHYKYIGVLLQEFVLKLDQSFLLAAIPFLDVFHAPGGGGDSEERLRLQRCSVQSLADLERELGLPLAGDEEYAAPNVLAKRSQQPQQQLSRPQRSPQPPSSSPPSAASTSAVVVEAASAGLEQEFSQQVEQMAHLRAVLATLTAQLAQEQAQAHSQPGAGSPDPQQQQSLSRLAAEVSRVQATYARVSEANHSTALAIQESSKRRLLAAAEAKAAEGDQSSAATAQLLRESLGSPSLSPDSTLSPRPLRPHVVNASASYSWVEGADQSKETYPVRHGHTANILAANQGHGVVEPYRGWMGEGAVEQHGRERERSRWVQASSSQNSAVVRTLTALVNQALRQLDSRAGHARRRAAASPDADGDDDLVVAGGSGEQEQMYYLERLELNTLECTFSFFTLPSYSGSGSSSSRRNGRQPGAGHVSTWHVSLGNGGGIVGAGQGEFLSARAAALAAAVSSRALLLASAEDAHLRVNGLRVTHSFITLRDLSQLLSKHYQKQLTAQLFELLGSSHVLGNPIGLISNLGTGVFDMLNEPLSGAIKGPTAFGVGVAVGMGSFLKHSVRGVATTASSLLGTIGNASATLSADPEYLRRRKLGRIRQPAHVASGLIDGGKHLTKGLFDGLSGVFTAPVQGAMQDGAVGLLKGLGRGLVGAVVKPVTGVFDAVTTLSDGIKNTTTLFEARVVPQRPPRILYGPEQLIRPYSAKEVSASCFLDTRSNLRLEAHQRETYVDHVALVMRPARQVLKDNEARMEKSDKVKQELARAVHNGQAAQPAPTAQAVSLPRSTSNASDLPMDLTGGGVGGGRLGAPAAPGGAAGGAAPSASSSSLGLGAPVDIAFVVTDHSLICVKLDLLGSMNASINNSSSSSARATAHSSSPSAGASGAGAGSSTSSMNSSSSSSASSSVSRYARILWSFLWLSIVDVSRPTPSLVVLRVLVPPRQARDLRGSERAKALFPFALEEHWSLPAHSAAAAAFARSNAAKHTFSSSTSYFAGGSGKQASPLLLTLQCPCPTANDAQTLEGLLRLAHVRAQAESAGARSAGAERVEPSAVATMQPFPPAPSPMGAYLAQKAEEQQAQPQQSPSSTNAPVMPPSFASLLPVAQPGVSQQRAQPERRFVSNDPNQLP